MRPNRRDIRRTGIGGLVLAAVVMLCPSTVVAIPSRAARSLLAGAWGPDTVTLITGDRVHLHPGGKVAISRAAGRAAMTFLTQRIGGHLYVIPTDALGPLRAGRLDRRLFDVTTLVEFGYDDRRADLPLIVTYAGGSARASTMAALAVDGTKVTRELTAVGGLAVRAAKPETSALWNSLTTGGPAARSLRAGVATVWLDGRRRPALDVSVPLIGAPAAWQSGLDGTGQTVAVLDSGIDASHPDLAGRVLAAANFTEGEEDGRDLVGHGTHVASTVAGSGAASGGRYRGVAPGARLLDGKVCGLSGCAESWILAGMQWAVDEGARVVNMSLGGPDTAQLDPVEQAVQTLTERYGTLFVVAAGNRGPDNSTVESPASADAALAVGAVTKAGDLDGQSSRGLRLGDSALKPDITAPGVDITAARSKDGFLGEPDAAYLTISGTSMATPHVAGAAAILAQQHPDWDATRLKAALMGSATPNPALAAHEQGAGRVDVARAVRQTVVANPASISFGRADWPHEDDPPVSATVTYRNPETAAVTLSLAVQAIGPNGTPAPAGLFRVDATSVTVPAGGEAAVSVTADSSVDIPPGYVGGRLIATGTTATGVEVAVQTPFALDREAESYDLTLTHTTRSGAPATEYSSTIIRTDEFAVYDAYEPDGTAIRRLPRGRYLILTAILEGPDVTMLVQPRLDLTSSQAVAVDARLGRPIRIAVPHRSAETVFADVTAFLHTPAVTNDFSILRPSFDGVYTGQIGPDRAVPEFTSRIHATLAQLQPDRSLVDSPYAYLLTWYTEGRMATGLQRRLTSAQLATVRAEHAWDAAGTSGVKVAFADPPDRDVSGWHIEMPFRLPFTRHEYYNTDGGIRWTRVLDEYLGPELVSKAVAAPVTLRPGRTTTERWNRVVFGPTLAAPPFPELWASRTGDTLQISPPIYGDGAGREVRAVPTNASTVLYRDGRRIAEEPFWGGFFEVPPGPARYRLELRAERGEPFVLSTKVEVVWTFRSRHVAGDVPVRLPLSVVRFTPPVDHHNTAPAGRPVAIPVAVVAHPGSAAGGNRSLTVEVSYDDGRTWRRVPLTGQTALVHHPAVPGFVSLRATAEDSHGNTVRQTVIRAYRTGR